MTQTIDKNYITPNRHDIPEAHDGGKHVCTAYAGK